MDQDQLLEKIYQEILDERFTPKPPLDKYLDPHFPQQNKFVLDKSRFINAQCSRRAGKTNGLAIRFLNTMETHPGCFCPYIALTRESARNIMWAVLQEQDAKFKIGCTFTESNLTMTHPNGARLQLFGADMKNFIRRLKGTKTPGAAIDETQDFGSHLESLVDDVLTPTLTDYEDSWLAIVGTPGPVPMGYFYDVSYGRKHGFSHHEWTLYDNPYLPNAAKFVEELKLKRKWDDTHPTLLREWQNKWVLDLESLLIKYDEGKNNYDVLPITNWNYILGIDLGFKDSDALAVIAWSESNPNTYLVHEEVTSNQDISNLVDQINKISKVFDISKMVVDTGGLGKKIAEELIRRHKIPVQAADKARKMENVSFLNDCLRMGTFKAKSSSRFAEDSYKVQIDWDKTTPDKIKVKDSFHSDIIDAVLYAFKESPAFTYQKPKVKPPYQSKEWAAEEVSEMEQSAEDFFKKQEIPENYWG